MSFLGRSRELGALRYALDQPVPQLLRVSGLPGVGKSALVRRAVESCESIVLVAPPLPAPMQLAAFRERIDTALAADAEWVLLFTRVVQVARSSARPVALVIDDAHRLTESRARWTGPLAQVLRDATAEEIPLHIVLVGRASELPALEGVPTHDLRVGPLPLRVAAPLLPGNEPHHVVRAYGVFGGIPRVLRQLDTSITVGTNVRRLVLDLDGSLAAAPLTWLERELQKPSRYMAIMRALAFGESDWGTIHEGVPDLTRSGQIAPYLKRLEQLGMIEVRTALDAKPGSRASRYQLSDPFLAFWFRFALPWRTQGRGHERPTPLREHYAEHIRPGIVSHMERMMPTLVRRHMERESIETVGASVRECGSLWGPEHDIPVAGTLSNGAIFYGRSAWDRPAREASPLDRLDEDVRRTRYGFGRERRLRLIFSGRPAPTWLRRETARRTDARLVEAAELLGR